MGLGRVWAGFCSRPARVQVRKQFHMMLPAFACFCLLGHAFARHSVELILDFNSSWLYCLLLLTFACACFGLLCLLWLLALSVPLLLRFAWSWALLGVFFCFLFSFFRFFDAYYVILHFCGDFRLFVFDFWRFGEGFGKDFERIFRGFLVIFSKCFENCDLAKNRVFPRENQ